MADAEANRLRRLLAPLPLVLLGVSTALAAVWPVGDSRVDATTLVLVGATAAWVLGTYTLRRVHRPGPMLVYVAGQHLLAVLLLLEHPVFFVFAAIGFVQAFDLLTPRWAFASVAVTSVLVNLLPAGVPDTPERVAGAVVAIGLQTFLVGWFGHLSQRVDERSEERRRLVADLRTALEENRGLHAQLIVQAREAGVQDERRRLAGEIHDTIAQGLTGIVTQLQAADRARDDPARREQHLERVHGLARDSLTAARRAVAALHPAELDDTRLPAAVRDLADRWSRLHEVTAHVETTGDPRPLPTDVEVVLFRVAQEALTNVAKHAGAEQVRITISYLEDTIMLDVGDDGSGLGTGAPPAEGGGYGLAGLRHRLDRVLGTLTVESSPGDGTVVNATVPA